VVVAAVWILAFFVGDKGPRDRFADRAWAQQAEGICAAAQARIAALPPARSFADVKPRSLALQQRADVGEQATDVLAAMVADLHQLRSADTRTTDLTALWLKDYDTYVQYRRMHIAKWRAGEDPRFVEPAVDGEPLSRGMDGFAEANGMPSCQVPGDFG
jgi:hypothetical protein